MSAGTPGPTDAAGTQPAGNDWNGLTRLERSLPSAFYVDPQHHARELERIWHRSWVYLCRAASLPAPLDYRTFELGGQPLLLVRDERGELRGFYNTCRHRGAQLCREPQGRIAGNTLTCPYHGWSYRLNGELARIPTHGRKHYVDPRTVALYPVALRQWNGFVYVNLAGADRPFGDHFNVEPSADTLAHWPLQDLVAGRTLTKTLRCNWKVFWENYNECLHCAAVHPALSALVPIYRRGIMEQRDDPDWRAHAGSDDPTYVGGLRRGAATWSVDGRSLGHEFPLLTEDERRVGFHFVTNLPSHYVVAHVDHVRSTRLLPLGPEETEVSVEWLFAAETLADPAVDIGNVVDFSTQVLQEDATACEFNQRGLRSQAHERGFLMPEEYDIFRFHEWLRGALERP